ncbi:hypothetical protein ACS5PU_02235 [Pedobacter sp. GSP4]|uniref:hypothetical protein n=1 Tax=Pedobacter sp. GSP4 TaxID=3453716 RepID=UPI003EEC1BDB
MENETLLIETHKWFSIAPTTKSVLVKHADVSVSENIPFFKDKKVYSLKIGHHDIAPIYLVAEFFDDLEQISALKTES